MWHPAPLKALFMGWLGTLALAGSSLTGRLTGQIA
jgi:hypothetical protein